MFCLLVMLLTAISRWPCITQVQTSIYADLKKHVYDKGMAAGDGSSSGQVLYNRGLYAAMLATEAARLAQKMSGKSDISPADMRDAMEAFSIDKAACLHLAHAKLRTKLQRIL